MLFDACKKLLGHSIPKRTFFGALNVIFNRVSPSRIKLVGPDRACAEWLMRNGAHIRWVGQEEFVSHYDSLPLDPEESGTYHIEEILAKDSSISHHGFPHLKGCLHVKRIGLIHCIYVKDACIDSLAYVSGSLQALEIRSCPELSADGLQKLAHIRFERLVSLKLGKLLIPDKLAEVVERLKREMPSCEVEVT